MAQVTIRQLNKMYDGNVHAVKDVNLEIPDREFVVLVGPSGCGKTTTLRMVAGLEAITSGDVLIGDTVVNDLAPMDRDIAMVFQNYALYPHKSVYDNMAFGLKMRKFDKAEIERRVKHAADILGIESLLARRPRQLSGGQRQRVALGRAIVRNPQVFLFDEPLSNLDAKLRVHMRVELRKLHERLGTTAIYVTHDQVEAMTLGDRVVVMKDGWVQQVGDPLTLYNTPANLFVASFIGSPAMNFANVSVVNGEGGLWVEATGLKLRLPGALASRAAPLVGKRAVLGIRPEDLRVANGADPNEYCMESEIEVVERLGSVTLLDTRVGSETVVASVEPLVAVRAHDKVRLAVTPERMHLFDSETEKAVWVIAKAPQLPGGPAGNIGPQLLIRAAEFPPAMQRALGAADVEGVASTVWPIQRPATSAWPSGIYEPTSGDHWDLFDGLRMVSAEEGLRNNGHSGKLWFWKAAA